MFYKCRGNAFAVIGNRKNNIHFFAIFFKKNLEVEIFYLLLQRRLRETLLGKTKRAISSVGSEHLVYTQGVISSNLISPTRKSLDLIIVLYLAQSSPKIVFFLFINPKAG